ncbi:MAG TPA: hypothetical protein VKV95_23630 [Terriglobia bacterium]|nr:hypothetical protein [Terriglobia bacterium]
MSEVISLQGPLEKLDGKLVLLIPLKAGGNELIACCRSMSEVQGEHLKVVIPDWLVGKLRVEEGDLVSVDNVGGKFNIHPVNPRPIQ